MSDALSFEDLAILDRMTAETIVPVPPPAPIRARVLEIIGATAQLDTTVPGSHESRTLRAEEGRWTDVAPGARIKRLSKDAQRGTVTCLLEIAPNAIVPAHDHHGKEDTYVVRGSCHIGTLGLYVGDFHHVEAGARHGDLIASEEGCTLLITFDLADAA